MAHQPRDRLLPPHRARKTKFHHHHLLNCLVSLLGTSLVFTIQGFAAPFKLLATGTNPSNTNDDPNNDRLYHALNAASSTLLLLVVAVLNWRDVRFGGRLRSGERKWCTRAMNALLFALVVNAWAVLSGVEKYDVAQAAAQGLLNCAAPVGVLAVVADKLFTEVDDLGEREGEGDDGMEG